MLLKRNALKTKKRLNVLKTLKKPKESRMKPQSVKRTLRKPKE